MTFTDEDVRAALDFQTQADRLFGANGISRPNAAFSEFGYHFLWSKSDPDDKLELYRQSKGWWTFASYWLLCIKTARPQHYFLRPLVIETYNEAETSIALMATLRPKAACSALRNALELAMRVFSLSLKSPTDATKAFEAWKTGASPQFKQSLLAIGRATAADVKNTSGESVLPISEATYRDSATAKLYSELCDYTHSNPGFTEEHILQADYVNRALGNLPTAIGLHSRVLESVATTLSLAEPTSLPRSYDILLATTDLIRVMPSGFVWGGKFRGSVGELLSPRLRCNVCTALAASGREWIGRDAFLLGEAFLHAGEYAEARGWYEKYDGTPSAHSNPDFIIRLLLLSMLLDDPARRIALVERARPLRPLAYFQTDQVWNALEDLGVEESAIQAARTVFNAAT